MRGLGGNYLLVLVAMCSAALIAAFNLPAILFPFTLTPEESNLPPFGERETETKSVTLPILRMYRGDEHGILSKQY